MLMLVYVLDVDYNASTSIRVLKKFQHRADWLSNSSTIAVVSLQPPKPIVRYLWKVHCEITQCDSMRISSSNYTSAIRAVCES